MKSLASFPSVIGQCAWEGTAKDQGKWRYPSDWLEDKYPEEFGFCVTYKIDNDQIQDQHQSEMNEDGFFNSDTDCNVCSKNIPTGNPFYVHNQTQQRPICLPCAKEIKKEEDADEDSATVELSD